MIEKIGISKFSNVKKQFLQQERKIDDFKALLYNAMDHSKEKGTTNPLKDLCKEFESLWTKQIFQGMVKVSKMFGGEKRSLQQRLAEDMLHEQYSKIITKHVDFGLAKLIYEQLSKVD